MKMGPMAIEAGAEPHRGRIVAGPGDVAGLRGVLQVRPGPGGKVRVHLWTEGGRLLADFHARDGEVTVVEAPARDGGHKLERFPGSFWFYGEDSGGGAVDVGFLPDAHAGALALPLAVESEPKGRT